MRIGRIAAAICAAVLSPVPAPAAELPAAPYQVEATLWPVAARALDAEAPRRLIAIDLGSAEDGAKPAFAEPGASLWVLHQGGAAPADLVEIRKSCAFVCGVGVEESCHYQGLLAPESDTRLLGEPLLALAEDRVVDDYEPLHAKPAAGAQASWSRDFAALTWPPENASGLRVDRWAAETGELRASLRLASGEEKTVEDRNCAASEAAGLLALACPSLSLLAADGVPLMVSWTDYHPAAAEPVARMRIGGREAVLVRFSTKLDILHGILIRDGDRWVPLFRAADYPTVC